MWHAHLERVFPCWRGRAIISSRGGVLLCNRVSVSPIDFAQSEKGIRGFRIDIQGSPYAGQPFT